MIRQYKWFNLILLYQTSTLCYVEDNIIATAYNIFGQHEESQLFCEITVFFFIWWTLHSSFSMSKKKKDSSFFRHIFINVAVFTVLVSSHCKSIYDLPLQRKLLRYDVSVFFFLASFEVNLASFEVKKNSHGSRFHC